MEFGHHPEPAVDFCLEVDAMEQEIIDRKAGLPPAMDLGARIERAMQFKVGGDSKAAAAKRDLRLIELAFEAGVAGGQPRLTGEAIVWPKQRHVGRREDMSNTGLLQVSLDSDNDVCVSVSAGEGDRWQRLRRIL